jgi:type III restriction enzyme
MATYLEQADDNAAYRWEQHLLLGYERWKASQAEWQASGKKLLVFIMCDDTWLRLYQGQGLWDCARFAETQKFSSVS